MLRKRSRAASLALALLVSVIGCSDAPVANTFGGGTALSVSPKVVDLFALGETTRLNAAVSGGRGVSTTSVSWISLDPGIATVASNGEVTSRANGETRIVARNGESTDTALVRVSQKVAHIAIGSDMIKLDALGDTIRLQGEPQDSRGNPVPGATTTWHSLDPAIVMVSQSGLLSSKDNGNGKVVGNSDAASDTVDVSVEQSASSLSVVPGTVDFTYLGEVATLTLDGFDKKGQPIRANGVQWYVSDASVAQVDRNGVVTAVGNGTTQLQAKSGPSTSTASITVKQLITRVAVEPATFGLYVGQELAVDAAAYDAGGSVVPGTTTSWSSSASTVASVSNGNVKGVSKGSATVLASIQGRSAAASVSVNEVQVGGVVVNPSSASILAGQTLQLSATVHDANGSPMASSVTWSSSNTAVATISAGLVTGVSAGSATITAVADGKSATSSISVSVPVASVKVDPSTAALDVGTTRQLQATLYDASDNVLSGRTVTWTSSAPAIATVSSGGLVTAIKEGAATILAYSEGRTASSSINVIVPKGLPGDPTVLLIVSGSSQTGMSGAALDAPLVVAVLDDFANPVQGVAVTWSTRDGGSITAIVSKTGSDGRASARWTLGPDGGEQLAHASVGELTAVFTATATKVTSTVASLTVAPASLTLDALGATAQLTAAVRDQTGALIANADVAWSSSSAVAAVDTKGKVTAKSVGTALIIASSAGVADTAHVTVHQVPASVQLSSSSVSLNVGETHQLNAVVKDAGGTAIPTASVTWSSSAPDVASVSSDGRVSAIAAGSATVNAASGSLTASASVTVTGATPPPGSEPGPGIWLSASEIAALPTSGTAWSNLKKAADSNLRGGVLTHRDNHNTRVMAAALVAARLKDNTYRARVRDALVDVMAAPYGTEDGLARNRRLGTYAIAADLIGLRNFDPGVDVSFRTWLAAARDKHLTSGGGGNLASYHERRPNNYGTHAGFSRMAVALYLGDQTEFERAVAVFRGYLGDRSAYEGFQFREDFTWHADPDRPLGINPKGATKRDASGTLRNIDGVMPDDQRRCGSFQWPPCLTNYAWEGLQGAIGMAWLAHRQGHDAVNWSDQALLRAVTWLITQAEFPAVGDDVWQMHIVNHMYGTSFPAASPTQPGKNVGWTDWTHR